MSKVIRIKGPIHNGVESPAYYTQSNGHEYIMIVRPSDKSSLVLVDVVNNAPKATISIPNPSKNGLARLKVSKKDMAYLDAIGRAEIEGVLRQLNLAAAMDNNK